MDKKEFAKAALDEKSETFVLHVATLETSPRSVRIIIYSSQAAQIAALKQDEVLSKVLSKYIDYADVFSFNVAMELPENTGINKHIIELQKGKQLSYGPIYALRTVE